MGLNDTSPVPKKDAMGMDYIPVYDGDVPDGPQVKISLNRLQTLGVKTHWNQAARTRAHSAVLSPSLRFRINSMGFLSVRCRDRSSTLPAHISDEGHQDG